MELDKTEKKAAEIVLVMPDEQQTTPGTRTAPASPASSNTEQKLQVLENNNVNPSKEAKAKPSEITKTSHSPKKPPRPPQADSFIRRRSISKPKSRFVEEVLPNPSIVSLDKPLASPKPNPPKTSAFNAAEDEEEEEEEEEEVYKKEQYPESAKKRKKFGVRVLIELGILVLAMGCLVASLVVHRLEGFVIWGLAIWKWCLVVAVIFCGRLVSQWLITVLVFMIERNFLLRKKVLYFVYGLKNSVQVCIWLSLVLITWSLMFTGDERRSPKELKVLDYVSRALMSILVGSLLWLVKTLLVKILASSFHMSKFFDRIQESIFHQYVLQMLSGPPVMELAEKVGSVPSNSQLSFRSTGKGKGKAMEEEGLIDVGKLHKIKQEKVSAWTMKGLINVIRSSGLSTISNTIESFDVEEMEQRDKEITSEWEAKTAAYRIFKNVAKPNWKYIDRNDLLRFLSRDEVDIVLPLFEGALEMGKIKKSSLRNWVVKAYLDRKSLAHSLNDTKTAIKQLHKLASVLVILVIVITTLLLMGVATTKLLLLVSSQFLLVGFMFGNTCKTIFEAIIFVFVMHPFDVGDRCVIDGVQMIVEEMNILMTTFLRYDNEKIYYPNAVLATKPISNFYRSPDMFDSVQFAIDVSTPIDSIGALKSKIKGYIDNKSNHWQPNYSLVVKDIINVDKMNIALNVKHTMNYQNMPERNSRRSDLVLALKIILEELSIKYNLLPQEVQLSYNGSTPLPVSVRQSTC